MKPLRMTCFILSLAVLSSFYSPLEASPLKKPLSFQHFTPKEGLSSEMVFAIAVQGEEVWFGTEGGGATLFDRAKKTWKAFTTKGDPQAKDDGVSINWKNILSCNHVSVILPDEDRLWFGTYFYGFGGGGSPIINPRRPLRGRHSIRTTVRPRRLSPWLRTGTPSGSDRKKVFPCWTRRRRRGKVSSHLRAASREIS